MKNIGVSVSEVLAQKKKQTEDAEEVGVKEEEYHQMKNEMIFYLNGAPEYQISAVGEWCINKVGEVIGDVDVYFLHILTGQRCESAWSCLTGWPEPDEHATEKWEALCERIEEYENLEQDMCYEKTIGV